MKIAILGGGAFGTGIAHISSHIKNANVCIWSRN
jgi:glycerol-3-phosphate dehydrogenase